MAPSGTLAADREHTLSLPERKPMNPATDTLRTRRTAPRASGFRSDVQGLRTLAVVAVVIFHASPAILPGGFVGVDVFFVISGYLITSHLVRQLTTGRFSFADFYARRIRRLVPAALLVALTTLIISYLFLSPLRVTSISRDAAATALYVPNIWFSYTGVDYLSDHSPSPFQQYWSLGVEEQFYLLWPLLLALAWKIGRRSLKVVTITLLVLLACSFALSVVLTPSYETWSFFNLPMRAWQFAAGGAIGLIHLSGTLDWLSSRRELLAGLAWLGVVGIVACCIFLTQDVAYPGWIATAPTAATALVLFASAPEDRVGPSIVLGLSAAQWVGDRSYSIYLWHWPLLSIPAAMFDVTPWWLTAIILLLTAGLAHLTFLYVENPVRNAQRLKHMRSWRFLILSACIVGVFAIAAVASGSVLSKRPLASEETAPTINELAEIEFTSFVPSNGVPRLQDASGDLPQASEDGCSPGRYSAQVITCTYGDPDASTTYALFGDSHAAQWFPVAQHIAERDGARLITMFKASCSSIALTPYKDGEVDDFCVDWRNSAMTRLQDGAVDRVFIANLHRQSDGNGGFVDAVEWSDATTRTIDALSPTAVTVITDTPFFEESPIDCAITNLDDLTACMVPKDSVIDADWVSIEKKAVKQSGGEYVDLSSVYCTTTCAPYISDTLVYRDKHHLTASFTEQMAEPLAQLMLPLSGE